MRMRPSSAMGTRSAVEVSGEETVLVEGVGVGLGVEWVGWRWDADMKPKEARGLRWVEGSSPGSFFTDFRTSRTAVLEIWKGLENWVYDFCFKGSEVVAWEDGDCLGASRVLKMPSRDGFQEFGLGGVGDASEDMPLNKSSSISIADFFDLRISAKEGLSPSFVAELCCLVVGGFDDFGGAGAGDGIEKVCCSFGAAWKVGGGGRAIGSGFLSSPGFPHFPNSSGAGRNRLGLS